MLNMYPRKFSKLLIMAENTDELLLPPRKRFKKIPIYVVEEHNNALEFIYSAIGGKKLPVEGTTLLHLDAHPDMLIDRKLRGAEARAGRSLLPLLQIENWIVPAVAAGHIDRVVWLRPPWAKQFSDGTRTIHVGDHHTTGLLRVDSKEPYYLSDALYSSKLDSKREFKLTVAELSDALQNQDQNLTKLAEIINVLQPYVLDIDLDFFSTGNPFLSLYKNIGLYDMLEPIFELNIPKSNDKAEFEKAVEVRENQLQELEYLFQHLEKHGNFENYEGKKSELFSKVDNLAKAVISEAEKLGEPPDWWAVFSAGCTRDQGGLPHHISSEEEIRSLVHNALAPLLRNLPPPVLITLARSTEDEYCPRFQVELIQSLVLQTLKETFDTDEPALTYLTVNTY